jgi:hypothetical protein
MLIGMLMEPCTGSSAYTLCSASGTAQVTAMRPDLVSGVDALPHGLGEGCSALHDRACAVGHDDGPAEGIVVAADGALCDDAAVERDRECERFETASPGQGERGSVARNRRVYPEAARGEPRRPGRAREVIDEHTVRERDRVDQRSGDRRGGDHAQLRAAVVGAGTLFAAGELQRARHRCGVSVSARPLPAPSVEGPDDREANVAGVCEVGRELALLPGAAHPRQEVLLGGIALAALHQCEHGDAARAGFVELLLRRADAGGDRLAVLATEQQDHGVALR